MIVGFASEAVGCSATCAAYQRLSNSHGGRRNDRAEEALSRMMSITVVKPRICLLGMWLSNAISANTMEPGRED